MFILCKTAVSWSTQVRSSSGVEENKKISFDPPNMMSEREELFHDKKVKEVW